MLNHWFREIHRKYPVIQLVFKNVAEHSSSWCCIISRELLKAVSNHQVSQLKTDFLGLDVE